MDKEKEADLSVINNDSFLIEASSVVLKREVSASKVTSFWLKLEMLRDSLFTFLMWFRTISGFHKVKYLGSGGFVL